MGIEQPPPQPLRVQLFTYSRTITDYEAALKDPKATALTHPRRMQLYRETEDLLNSLPKPCPESLVPLQRVLQTIHDQIGICVNNAEKAAKQMDTPISDALLQESRTAVQSAIQAILGDPQN